MSIVTPCELGPTSAWTPAPSLRPSLGTAPRAGSNLTFSVASRPVTLPATEIEIGLVLLPLVRT